MIATPITSISMESDDENDISVLFSINKHAGCVNSVLCFGGKFVTCSSDKTIRVWDSKKGVNLKVFKTHNASVRKLLKWGKDGFLSASDDGSVQYFSIADYSVHKTILQVHSDLYNLLRLSYDLLLVVTGEHELLVVSYSKRKVLKIIEEKTSIRCCPILSRDKSRYKNCFYVNSDVQNSPILLMNFTELSNIKLERTFDGHTGQVNSLSSLMVQNETLLCSGGSSVVHMYNTSVGEDDLNYLRRISLSFDVTCLRTELNRYVCCGDEMGGFHIFDSRQGLGNVGTIEELHKKDIQDIRLLSLQTGSNLRFVLCSKDRTIKVVSLEKKIESFDKIRYEQTKHRYVRTKKRISSPSSLDSSKGEKKMSDKSPPKKKKKTKKEKKKKKKKKEKKKLRMFSFFEDDEDHEMYKAEGGDPLKEAEEFIERTKRIISPNKYREEKKKKEEDEDDFIFFEDTTDDDEDEETKNMKMKAAVVPRVTSVSFFKPPFKKRFGF